MDLVYIKNDAKRDNGYRAYDCPYNEGCRCAKKECWKCGWNPTVAKERAEAEKRRKEVGNNVWRYF